MSDLQLDPEALNVEVKKEDIEGRIESDFPELRYEWRKKWRPRKPEYIIPLRLPAENVLLTFTGTPPCKDDETCERMIREMQETHIADGCSDIQFNFLVGGNGAVYEGRGWNVNPQKRPEFIDLDRKSLDIAYIGMNKGQVTYRMRMAKSSLIKLGVVEYFIDEDYNLVEVGSENMQEQLDIALGKIKKPKIASTTFRHPLSSEFVNRVLNEAMESENEDEVKSDKKTIEESKIIDINKDVQEKKISPPQKQSKKPKKLSKRMKLMQEKLKEIGATIEYENDMECINPKNKRSKVPYMNQGEDEELQTKTHRVRNKEMKKRRKYERIVLERLRDK